ncbi:MAG: hypothetical protein ACE5EL_07830, partial [Anaerolineae bacterium]
AVRQLEETRVNLTRVKDVLAELGPRLKRMTRLSERAQRHEDLATEMEAALAASYGSRWRRALERLDASRVRIADLRGSVAHAEDAIAELEGQLVEAEAEADANLRSLQVARGKHDSVQRDLAAAREAAAVARARLEGLAARRAEREAAATSRAQESRRLAQAAADARLALEASSEAYAASVRENDVAQEALRGAEAEASSWARGVADLRREAVAVEARAAAVGSSLEALAAGDEQAKQHHAALAAEIAELEEGLSGTAAATDGARGALEAAGQRVVAAAAALEAAEAEEAAAEATLRRQLEVVASTGTELSRLEARCEALDAKIAAEERPDAAHSRVAAAGGESVLGAISQFLEIETGWEAAAAAALGGLADGLVMSDAAAIEDTLRHVTGAIRGQVALVPGHGDLSGASWKPAKGERRALEAVTCPAAPAAAERLLADCAFVEDLAAASTAVGRRGGPPRAATRDGRLVLRNGVVVVGAPARQTLALEAERRGMPERLETARKAEADAQADLKRLRDAVESLADRRTAAAEALAEADAGRRRAAADVEAAQAKSERAQRELDWAREASLREAPASSLLVAWIADSS